MIPRYCLLLCLAVCSVTAAETSTAAGGAPPATPTAPAPGRVLLRKQSKPLHYLQDHPFQGAVNQGLFVEAEYPSSPDDQFADILRNEIAYGDNPKLCPAVIEAWRMWAAQNAKDERAPAALDRAYRLKAMLGTSDPINK